MTALVDRHVLRPLAAVLFVLALLGCTEVDPASSGNTGSQARGDAPQATPVETRIVASGSIDRIWSAVGSLMANESLTVRPEIAGRIVRLGFEEGGTVKRGAVLFELEASVERAQVDQASADLSLATRNAKRAEELFASALIAAADRDATRAGLDAATAALALARARLDKTVIRAPFAGRAGLRKVAGGDYVNPGQELVMLEDIGRMKLEFRLPELALADVRTGQPVQVELDAFPGERFVATVYALDSGVAMETRSIALRALLDNPDLRLRAGQFARVRLIVETQDNALLIPEQAIVPRGDQAFVFVVENGRAVERTVRLGQRRPGEVQVLEGLKLGEQIVTGGVQKISSGSVVAESATAPETARAAP